MSERRKRVVGRLGAIVVVVALVAACGPTVADPAWNGGEPSVAPVYVPPQSTVVAHAAAADGGHWALVHDRDGAFVHKLTAAGAADPAFAGGSPRPSNASYLTELGVLGSTVGAQILPTADGGVYVVRQHVGSNPPLFDGPGTSVIKVTAAGNSDPAFNSFGYWVSTTTYVGALDASGRVVLAGPDHLMRLTTAGSTDVSFGGIDSNGLVPRPADLRGRIIVIGDQPVLSGASKVARLAADGSTLWATTVAAGPGSATLSSIAAGPGGAVVAATGVDPSNGTMRLHRLTAAGAPDTTFDTDGTRDVGAPWPASTPVEVDDIAIDSAGRVIVPFRIPGTASSEGRILRIRADGSWDSGWGASGGLLLDGTPQARPAGRLLPAKDLPAGVIYEPLKLRGAVVASGTGIVVSTRLAGDPDGELVRYTAAGQVDPSFDGDGVARFDALSTLSSRVVDLALVAGPSGSTAAQPAVALLAASRLVRFRADGEIDTDWGTDGYVTVPGAAAEVEQLADGTFIVASRGSTALSLTRVSGPDGQAAPWAEVPLLGAGSTSADWVRLLPVPGGGLVVAVHQTGRGVDVTRLDAAGVIKAQRSVAATAVRDTFDIVLNAYSVVVATLACPTGAKCRPQLTAVNTSNLKPRANFNGQSSVTFENPAQDWSHLTRLLWTGSTLTLVGTTEASGIPQETWIARRVASTGAPTPGFGTGGVVDTDAPVAEDAMVDTSGRTIVVGNREKPPYVRRFTKAGASDTAFGTGGSATLPSSFTWLADGELDAGGRIVLGGKVDDSGAVLRLIPA